MKKWIALVLTACIVLTSLAGCGSSGDNGVASVSSVNVSMGYQITTLDGGINTETGNDYIINHMYSGLFRLDENGNPQNELCEDYTISEDGMTYTFTLIDDAVWSDGTPVTAYDFEYSVLRALSYGVDNAYTLKEVLNYLKGAKEYNERACEVGSSFDCTKEDHSDVGISAKDDKTLVIELSSPCAFLPALMSSRVWVAVPQSTPQHDSQWSLQAGNPTSGPYVLSEINENEKAILTKSDTYFNKDAITMDKITYYCMTDEDARTMAFETGEVDVALYVDAAAADKYKDTEMLKTIQDGTVYFVALNSAQTGPEYLKDPDIRRALALAIDKDAISEVLGAEYYPAVNGYIPHGAPGVNGDFRDEGDADGYTLTYDPDQAKELLKKAGYDESNPLVITYKYSNNDIHADVATMLESFWSAVGVEVKLDCVEYGVYYDQVDQGDFELCRYSDSINSNASRLLTLWSTEGQVVAAVSDPTYDQMCKDALQITDNAEYINALHELEDYLVEENVYVIPLFEYMSPVLVNDYVKGMEMNGKWPFFGYCTATK